MISPSHPKEDRWREEEGTSVAAPISLWTWANIQRQDFGNHQVLQLSPGR